MLLNNVLSFLIGEYKMINSNDNIHASLEKLAARSKTKRMLRRGEISYKGGKGQVASTTVPANLPPAEKQRLQNFLQGRIKAKEIATGYTSGGTNFPSKPFTPPSLATEGTEAKLKRQLKNPNSPTRTFMRGDEKSALLGNNMRKARDASGKIVRDTGGGRRLVRRVGKAIISRR